MKFSTMVAQRLGRAFADVGPGADGVGGKSAAVMTALTPGSASALEASMLLMMAWACGLRLTRP